MFSPSQEYPEKPASPWLTTAVWKACCDMEEVPAFKGMCKDIVSTPVHCKLGRWEVNNNYAVHVQGMGEEGRERGGKG